MLAYKAFSELRVFYWSNAGKFRVDDFKLLVNDRVIPDGCLKPSPNAAEALGLALWTQLPVNAEVHTSRFQRVWSTEKFALAHSAGCLQPLGNFRPDKEIQILSWIDPGGLFLPKSPSLSRR